MHHFNAGVLKYTEHKVTLEASATNILQLGSACTLTSLCAARTCGGGLSPSGARCSFRGMNHAGLSHMLINHFRLCERSPECACIMHRKTGMLRPALCAVSVFLLCMLCVWMLDGWKWSSAAFQGGRVCVGAEWVASRCCCGAATEVLQVGVSVGVCECVFSSVCTICWWCVNGCTDKCCRCVFVSADVWTFQC